MRDQLAGLATDLADCGPGKRTDGRLVLRQRRCRIDANNHKRAKRLDSGDGLGHRTCKSRRTANISMHLAVAQEVRRSLGHHRRNLDLMRIIGRIDRQLMAAAGYGDRDERHRGDEQATSGHCDIRNVQTRRFAIVSACAQGKYPPAEPGALGIGPLEAAVGVADAAPNSLAT